MRIVINIIIGVVIALTGSCVDPFNVPQMTSMPRLVVDATITDEPGPHRVTLTYTANLSNYFTNQVFASGATVSIKDETADSTIILNEVSNGRYETSPTWKAKVGREYTLHIELRNGRQFRSETQTVFPSGEIDSLAMVFMPNSINQDDPFLPQNSLAIFIDSKGAESTSGFFRWRWTGTYQVVSNPAGKTAYDPVCNCLVPAPPPCVFPICTCCVCWVSDFSNTALVSDNRLSSDNTFRNVYLGRIPIEPFRFFTRYHISVEQMSLSESAYEFWRLVRAQQQGATDIFQPNVVRIRGNIMAVTDPDEPVFGLASFSSVAKVSKFIYRSEIPQQIPSPPLIPEDCRLLFNNDTNVKPDFW